MPTLNWIGKEHVVNLHNTLPYRMIHCENDLSVGDVGERNLLIEGDNLHALKALLPYFKSQVKCIYIDEPYNTGNEGWVYNDKLNAPEVLAWLGQVVGGPEDFTKHEKWLCMMYPRLQLLYQLLSEDGAIFISIDDNEVASLRFILDEIFGQENFVATIIWQKADSPKNTAVHFSEDHEYIVVYAKNAETWRPNRLERTEEMIDRYKNPDQDKRGPWLLSDLAARNFYAHGRYPITTPSGRVIEGPPAGSYWRISKERFEEFERDGRIWWGVNGNNRPGIKRFLSEVQEGIVPRTIWTWQEAGSSRNAKQELSRLMTAGTSEDLFITPKPTQLIKRILQLATNSDSLVLDSFAGSGATGQAVMQLNAEDGGNRRFLLVEMESHIARTMTMQRLKRVVEDNGGGLLSQGGFRFCTLSDPLFDAEGRMFGTVRFSDLAHHIFFTETGEPLPHRADSSNPLIGCMHDIAYYLLWHGPDQETILNLHTLRDLLPHPGPKVVYADGCEIAPERLAAANIVFRQIPYDVRGI